jgi:glycosyltransferase involved in cell wall biosynthesis
MDLSVIIPAHKEPYLQRTVDLLHDTAKGPIDVIVVLDDYWPDEPLTKCTWIHAAREIGMRTAINMAVSQSRARYIMKCDGHCLFKKHWDAILKRDYEPNYVIVPVLYGLKVDKEPWARWGRRREFFSINKQSFRGTNWPEYAERCKDQKLCDLMTFQGSCWFMERAWFDKIGGEDDVNYANGGREAQEISIKTWLGGGRCVLDRNLWYAHWRKPREHSTIRRANRDKSKKYVMKTYMNDPAFAELIERFKPVPTWHDEGLANDKTNCA